MKSKNVSYIKIKTDDLESSNSSRKNFPRLTMSGNVAAPLPGSILVPARWQAIPLQSCFFPPKPRKWGKEGKAD